MRRHTIDGEVFMGIWVGSACWFGACGISFWLAVLCPLPLATFLTVKRTGSLVFSEKLKAKTKQ